MRIEVETLNEEGRTFEHTYAPGEPVLGDDSKRLIAPTTVSVVASRRDDKVRFRGNLRTNVEALCDRCLQPLTVPLEVDFETQYAPAGAEAVTEEVAELQADDLDFAVYEGDSIDMDELVREQVLLTLPMRLLCREDCKGLCPTCGADLNRETCNCEQKEIDPRWAALAPLKRDNE